MDGSSVAGVVQGFNKIAEMLRIPLYDDPAVDRCQLVADLLKEEKKGPFPAWLMIIDNFSDVDVLLSPTDAYTPMSIPSPTQHRYLLDYLPKKPSPQGYLLITTRNRQIAERITHSPESIEIAEFFDAPPSENFPSFQGQPTSQDK